MTVDQSYDEEQLRLMQEMCIIVDKDDQVLRPETKKKCHLMTEIATGLLHRAFSVFIFNSEGKLLLQQRADEKITFPGYFTNACCSHPLFCEEEMEVSNQIGVKRACVRKLNHELGISKGQVPLDSLEFLTRIHYLAPSDGLWGEHEIDYIFILKGDLDLDINPNEVKSTRYVSREELVQLFQDAGNEYFKAVEIGSVKITPWFKLIVENFLFKWWDRLDSLGEMREEDIIHRL